MNTSLTTQAWIQAYEKLASEADAAKQSMALPANLLTIYDHTSDESKLQIHNVLSDWLTSEEADLRWLAKLIVRQRKLFTLKSIIEVTIKKLESQPLTPSTKYELIDLRNLVQELTQK